MPNKLEFLVEIRIPGELQGKDRFCIAETPNPNFEGGIKMVKGKILEYFEDDPGGWEVVRIINLHKTDRVKIRYE